MLCMLCAHGVLELGAAGPIRSYSCLVEQIIFTGGSSQESRNFCVARPSEGI